MNKLWIFWGETSKTDTISRYGKVSMRLSFTNLNSWNKQIKRLLLILSSYIQADQHVEIRTHITTVAISTTSIVATAAATATTTSR